MPLSNADETFANEAGHPAQIQPPGIAEKALSASLEDNVALIKDVFFNDDTVKFRRIGSRGNTTLQCCAVYIDGLVDRVAIEKHIIVPVVDAPTLPAQEDLLGALQSKIITANDVEAETDVEHIAESIVSGDTLLLVEGFASVLIVNTKGWTIRSVDEPSSEKIQYGPKEGFVESMLVNLSLIRRKIRSPELKFKFKTLGARTHTRACIVYHEALVNQDILAELVQRLETYDLDSALGVQYIKEVIRDAPYSPFDTIGATERPDVVVGRILEGRIAVLVDGSPEALTLPFLNIEKFQSSQDYFTSNLFSSLMRILRQAGFWMAICFPAIYLSVVAFHKEFLPTAFLLSMVSARQDVPFPSVVELILMLVAFELLREAGSRMPSNIGQALSIVGALVLGQAAVQARIASAPIIIVAAISAISGMVVPRADSAVILLKFVYIAASFILGIYGFILAFSATILHLFNMRSFGVSYMLDMTSFDPQSFKDTIVRAPWWLMKLRPKIGMHNRVRKGNK